MAEVRVNKPISRRIRHRGRASQIPIYVGKQLRFFIYQSDWKVLPMAAIIAALVSMVIRKDFFLTMEGNPQGRVCADMRGDLERLLQFHSVRLP